MTLDSFFTPDFATHELSEPLTQQDVVDALRQVREALADEPERPARIIGRRRDVYDLLIDMGCSFEKREEGLVPVPVLIGSLSLAVIEDEDAPPGLVREEFADGRTGRSYLRAGHGYKPGPHWHVIEDGAIIDKFLAAPTSMPTTGQEDHR